MGFNSAFKGLKLLKTPGTGVLNYLSDPVLNVLNCHLRPVLLHHILPHFLINYLIVRKIKLRTLNKKCVF